MLVLFTVNNNLKINLAHLYLSIKYDPLLKHRKCYKCKYLTMNWLSIS